MINELLTEKLRPKELRHMILPPRIRDVFKEGLQQNVIFAGSPGCGKTTLAKILAAPHPYDYIDMSTYGSIETIRTRVTDFCSTISIEDGNNAKKVVILDECEGASFQAILSLKITIDRFSKNTRFILITNYLNKIPEPIQSRLECFIFDPQDQEEEKFIREEWRSRINLILSKIGITCTEGALALLIKKNFPDMRGVLNTIQRWSIQGISSIDEGKISDSWNYEDLYKLIVSTADPINNYKMIAGQFASDTDDVMASLGNDFINWIIDKRPDLTGIIPGTIILVAQHQAQRNLVIDPLVSLLSLVFSIEKLVQQHAKK